MEGFASGGRHGTLRVVGAICTGVGAILLPIGVAVLALGLYGLFFGLAEGPPGPIDPLAAPPRPGVRFVGGLGGAVAAIWSAGISAAGLQFLGIGALLRLAIQVEENTRASARLLEQARSRTATRADDAPAIFLS